MNSNETLQDIVAGMRGENGFPVPFAPMRAIWLSDYHALADRIEAAWKRDRADAELYWSGVGHAEAVAEFKWGNMAVMRKALKVSRDFAEQIEGKTGEADVADDAGEIVETCEEALKSPPRNCDVGTPEEQIARFKKFCYSRGISCKGCPIRDKVSDDNPCCFFWMAEPYGEGGAECSK